MQALGSGLSLARVALVLGLLSGAVLTAVTTHAGSVSAARAPQTGPTWPPAPKNVASLPAVQPLSCTRESSLRSLNSKHPEWMFFQNRTAVAISLYWLSFTGQRTYYTTLAPGGTWLEKTFATHPWVAVPVKTGRCAGIYVVPFHASRALLQMVGPGRG